MLSNMLFCFRRLPPLVALAGLMATSLASLTGCATELGEPAGPPPVTSGYFLMADGTDIPYREWLPDNSPSAVILALHGMNDSRDAWEFSGPTFAAAGVALVAPDLRGFGATPTRGRWPGTGTLIDDVRQEVEQVRSLFPRSRLFLMAESMGAAVLMILATGSRAPGVDGYILLAPAVWGRADMNFAMRALLWLMDGVVPSLRLTSSGFVKVAASDNREALIRLSSDPLTIHSTRVDAIKGLVDLMDSALTAASHMPARSLFLTGGRDELIPPRATIAAWRALPPGPARAYYPGGYHLLLRDTDRARTIDDILSWMRDPHGPLPSGADRNAQAWQRRDFDQASH